MPFTTQQVLDELNADPAAYSALSADAAAALLNLRTGAKSGTIYRRAIPMAEVLAAITWSEFVGAGLNAAQRTAFQILTSPAALDASSATVRAAFVDIFPAGPTRTALAALAQRLGSRAEVLWGEDTLITGEIVARARGTWGQTVVQT